MNPFIWSMLALTPKEEPKVEPEEDRSEDEGKRLYARDKPHMQDVVFALGRENASSSEMSFDKVRTDAAERFDLIFQDLPPLSPVRPNRAQRRSRR